VGGAEQGQIPQLAEFSARVRKATSIGHALFEHRLVAREVVADECVAPGIVFFTGSKELARVLPGARLGEVEDYDLDGIEARCAIAPEVGLVSLALAGLEHRYRRLVGVQDGTGKQFFANGVDQRLKSHAASANPLRERRARDREAGASEDRLLPIQQVIGELATSSRRTS